jgi:hypothetical protein
VPHRQCLSLPSAPTLCCGCKLLSALAMNKGGERENWSTVFAKSIAAVKGNISTLKLSMRVSSCGLRGGVSSECGEHDPFFAWIDTTPAARLPVIPPCTILTVAVEFATGNRTVDISHLRRFRYPTVILYKKSLSNTPANIRFPSPESSLEFDQSSLVPVCTQTRLNR